MKNDKYRRARGGTAQIIGILCAQCGEQILHYQKDGIGWLKRCYLNRIFGSEKWEKLQYDKNIKEPKDLPNLICSCGKLIGVPMKYNDGRLAFRLEWGTFRKKKNKTACHQNKKKII